MCHDQSNKYKVTPYAGVWIEIEIDICRSISRRSLPTRECGLKCQKSKNKLNGIYVTPYAGVWIEIIKEFVNVADIPSLPTRECGLK